MAAELRATYRVQLHPGFGLKDAAEIVDYLAELGISHLYCSPYLQAAPGSTHGYDIVNPRQVNEELGGAEALGHLHRTLEEHNMGQILDVVPNHMAIISGPKNPWWWDVLENGPSSPYAAYFDIDWDPPEARHSNVVLVPVLGDHYGRVLEAGEVVLTYQGGVFTVRYYDNLFPVNPRSLGGLLAQAAQKVSSSPLADTLNFIAGAYERLPLAMASDRSRARRRYRDQTVLRGLLSRISAENPEVKRAIQEVVQEINQDPDALDAFLELQNYRLVYWRITQRELGYRRFFDINSLIGLRMEDEEVFLDTHARVLGWLSEDWLDGLRIDHPDGLRDPQEYFQRLHQRQPEAWIVIEKILEPSESLPASWPVAGTTGYDFLNRLNGLFVNPANAKTFTDLYTHFTGEAESFTDLALVKKRLAIDEVLGSDLNRLTAIFLQVIERHRRYRDYTRGELRQVLRETAAHFPVYRTYVRAVEGELRASDIKYINEAVEGAKASLPDLDAELFDFFRDLLLLQYQGELETELVMRFQQFTGPVMAKGVEDTAFYTYNRFISLNEVGGSPGRFGVPVESFHEACQEASEHWPQSMLATSTHDTKRSEDVRARLDVLSELPEQWSEAVLRWHLINEPHRVNGQPSRSTEYFLYQTLVGTWPIEEERILTYMEKAAREAKTHTSWRNPDQEYEALLADFIKSLYGNEQFLADLEEFVSGLVEPGWINSLSQTLVKLTAPGVPDFYQGSELWIFHLVDPDNRQPVDYNQRRQALAELRALKPAEIWARAADGLPKMWVIQQALALRRRLPQFFGPESTYHPLEVNTPYAAAFGRGDASGQVGAITVVPRLVLTGKTSWNDTTVRLPPGQWRNEMTQETIEGGEAVLQRMLAHFPVALFAKENGA